MINCDHLEATGVGSTVLLVSYSTGMPGFSPSEWVDDKLEAARQAGQYVIVVTSASSKLQTCSHQRVIRVASISRADFEQEQLQCAESGLEMPMGARVLPTIFGRLFDSLFRALAGSRSDGRWSWTFAAFPAILFASARHRPDAFFATGGPSSAQFAACLASFAPWVKAPVLEFQDPFLGLEMNLSSRTLRAMRALDQFMIRRARKYVTVSKGSLGRLLSRTPHGGNKLEAIYPFAHPKLVDAKPLPDQEGSGPVEFLHTGTLYGSRTLTPLFSVLDKSYEAGELLRGSVIITNLGADYTDSPERSDYQRLPAVPRTKAITRALHAHCLLLVQHSDSRSLETIPFKLYDYLNLSIPILVIGRNGEIRGLLSEADFYTEIGDVDGLTAAIHRMVARVKSPSSTPELRRPPRDAFVSAWLALLS